MPKHPSNYRLRKKVVPDPESSESDDSTTEYEDDESYSEESTEESTEEEVKPKNKKSKTTKKTTRKSSSSEDTEDEQIDPKQFQKLLSAMFPSKYMSKKVDSEEDDEEEETKPKKKKVVSKSSKKVSKKTSKKSKKQRRKKEESEDEDDEDSDDEDEEESSEEDDDESSEEDDEKRINIILSMNTDDEYANYFGCEEDDDEDDDDEDCDTDDEETFMKEKFEKIEQPPSETDSKEKKKKDKKKKEKKLKEEEESDENDTPDVESEYLELLDLKKDLHKKLLKNQKSKILKKRITECSEDIKQLVKTARTKNTKKYKKLLIQDNKTPNEMTYFKKKMSNSEQLRIMKELKEVNDHMGIDKPYRISLLESQIPPKLKSQALQKLNLLNMMDSTDSEYFKIKNWMDNFMRIPFCKYTSLSVNIDDGIEKCHEFMANARATLDKCVYGLDDAKMQILQMVGQWIANPNSLGSAIAINGPPGTGKTTLVKDGISKILGREFVFIPLGGTGDASFLEGHSYTYEGSMWGKIVQSLMDCQTMNPVFFFDELDKLSDTPKGEEIIGILTHLTDTTQNSQFHDKYFSEVDFDLSKCLFIFSYNDESKVNPILKDRMYRIQTKGYDVKEKIVIARDYMLPKIREQINFKTEDIIIPDDTIKYIVSTTHLTQQESGVRNMKRCLEIVHTKLNLFRLVRPEDNIFAKEINLPVTFPMKITNKEIDILIKNDEKQSQSLLAMYC
jgi:ATP-dependent Lon protease